MIDVLRFVVGLVADVVRRAATQRGPHSAREASIGATRSQSRDRLRAAS
jgi:hypothetical protein